MVNLEGICEKAISRIDNNEEIYVKRKINRWLQKHNKKFNE
mgnify:FL=1